MYHLKFIAYRHGVLFKNFVTYGYQTQDECINDAERLFNKVVKKNTEGIYKVEVWVVEDGFTFQHKQAVKFYKKNWDDEILTREYFRRRYTGI